MQISKVLIANRGEIALRVIRTLRDIGVKSVAIYADEDRNAPYVKLADEAYSLEGSGFNTTYLNADKVLELALKSGADAIHPGYGLLSENADFASRCEASGIKWIGPSGEAINALGDKVKARNVAEKANVSPVPGISDFIESADVVRKFIADHGYPVILKRADGGGGQGITVVRLDSELENFLVAHNHDLNFYFIERFVERARHVETQCARDFSGNFTVVSTRDCSVQRRNQKLVEEAPAPFLTDEINAQIFEWSKSLFETVNYTGLGTCEFLLETKEDGSQSLYFLEVNPRIQVEHTVSEEVSGLDLVAEQIKIANGENLTLVGNLAAMGKNHGHSIELRITSEDPTQNMMPTAGVISRLDWPQGHGIRVESGVILGDTVTVDFDSMIAKVIITGDNRAHAIARTKRALRELDVQGICTPKELFGVIFNHSDFTADSLADFKVSTKWLENSILPEFIGNAGGTVSANGASVEVASAEAFEEFAVEIDGKRVSLKLPISMLGAMSSSGGNSGFSTTGGAGRRIAPRIGDIASGNRGGAGGGAFGRSQAGAAEQVADDIPGVIISQMQGIVVSVVVTKGQQVKKGDILVVLEAMKMENFIYANADGIVDEILVDPSDSVEKGQKLVILNVE